MSRTKGSKHKRIKFLTVIISVVLLCALSLFIYSKFTNNNSSANVATNTTNNTKKNASNNNDVNKTNISNDNNVTVSTDNSSKSSNVTSKNSSTPRTSASTNNTTSSKNNTNKTNYVVELPTNAEASKGNGITVDKATQLLKSKISSKNSQIKISYDNTQTKGETNYYVFQSYNSTGKSSSGDAHSDTLAWYYVNSANGDLYTYDLNNDVLNPLK